MQNPVMRRVDKYAKDLRTPAGYPAMPGYTPGATNTTDKAAAWAGGAQAVAAANREAITNYSQAQTGPVAAAGPAVTFDDIVTRTGIAFGVLAIAAVGTWYLTAANPVLALPAIVIFGITGFILAMVNVFKSRPSPALILAYAAAEGVVLAAVSFIAESFAPGIVIQAVLATFAVFAVTLTLFKFGLVRMTGRLRKILLIGLLSVLGFWGLSALSQLFGFTQGSFGDYEVAGIPLGIIIGLVAIVLGAISLISDFDVSQRAVAAGAPREIAWTCAFGMMVTVVWLYTEILRVLAYAADR